MGGVRFLVEFPLACLFFDLLLAGGLTLGFVSNNLLATPVLSHFILFDCLESCFLRINEG